MSHLKFIRHVLLVERIETDELETLCHHVEGLVVSFRANGHLVSADLKNIGQTLRFVFTVTCLDTRPVKTNWKHCKSVFTSNVVKLKFELKTIK